MKKEIGCFLVILCCCGVCQAQQVVSSGGYVMKTDVSVNWILGGSLSDISTMSQSTLNNLQKEQLIESKISLKVYPIPTSDFIHIEITPIDTSRFSLELYNSLGVKVISKTVSYRPVMQVDVSSLPSGMYILKVFQLSSNNILPGVEKIIKF